MIILILILGAILGSFFSVCVYRIPREKSIIYLKSHCESCKKNIICYDLIPIISWILLKGKCRRCKEKIGVQSFIIETLSATMFCILFLKFGLTIEFIKYGFLSSILLIAAFIDFNTTDVYFSISVVGLLGGSIFTIIDLIQGKNIFNIIISILIPIIIFGGILMLNKRKELMGLGDLEVLVVVAIFLMPLRIILALFLAIVLCGIIGIVILLKMKKKYIPFVPFIALGTFISIVCGEIILKYYFSSFII